MIGTYNRHLHGVWVGFGFLFRWVAGYIPYIYTAQAGVCVLDEEREGWDTLGCIKLRG